jgi:hypothetical protein
MEIREEIRELKKKKELTLETLRTFEGLEEINDEEGLMVLEALEQLAKMFYRIHSDSLKDKPCRQMESSST